MFTKLTLPQAPSSGTDTIRHDGIPDTLTDTFVIAIQTRQNAPGRAESDSLYISVPILRLIPSQSATERHAPNCGGPVISGAAAFACFQRGNYVTR